MRSTAGPGSFHIGGGNPNSSQQQLLRQIPTGLHGKIMERPLTRQGSDERGPLHDRPITQGMSRRVAAAGHINHQMSVPMGTLNNGATIDTTYTDQGVIPREGVMNRRTSSRRMNRVYGGAGSASASMNKLDANIAVQLQNQVKKQSPENGDLETVMSLPAGYDPIFNSNANTGINHDSTQIKIKPMRLSKGYEQPTEIQQRAREIFEADEETLPAAIGRGATVGQIENPHYGSENNQRPMSDLNLSGMSASPIYGRDSIKSGAVDSHQAPPIIDNRRTSKGKVIAGQKGHFHKKLTSKNTRKTAMESILEEDEHQGVVRDQPQQQNLQKPSQGSIGALRESKGQLPISGGDPLELGKPLRKQTTSKDKQQLKQSSGSNRSTIMSSNFQLKNENNEQLSTMQTSGGFSNTRRSPRDISGDGSGNKRGTGGHVPSASSMEGSAGQLRFRPQMLNQQNYHSVHTLKPIERGGDSASFRPLPGANLTSSGFNNIMEEEEFAYQDEMKQNLLGGNFSIDEQKRKRKLALAQITGKKDGQSFGSNQGSGQAGHQQSEPQLKNKISKTSSPIGGTFTHLPQAKTNN